MKNTKKGFTLVELLVVIAILAILASVAVVGYTAFLKKANDSKAESELHQIVTYVDAELMDDGKWVVVDDKATPADKTDDVTYTVTRTATGTISVADDDEDDTTVPTLEGVIKLHFADLFTGDAAATLEVDDKALTYTTANGGTSTQNLR